MDATEYGPGTIMAGLCPIWDVESMQQPGPYIPASLKIWFMTVDGISIDFQHGRGIVPQIVDGVMVTFHRPTCTVGRRTLGR